MCTLRPESSTPMEIALKSIVIDFDALCARVVSANIGRYWNSSANDTCRDTRDISSASTAAKRYHVLIAFSELVA